MNQYDQQIIKNLRNQYPDAVFYDDEELLELWNDYNNSSKEDDFSDWLN